MSAQVPVPVGGARPRRSAVGAGGRPEPGRRLSPDAVTEQHLPRSGVARRRGGVRGCAQPFPERRAAAGSSCPPRDGVCSTATQVGTAVLSEGLQRQLKFIARERFPSSSVLSFAQGLKLPYAFCPVTTASQGLILLPFLRAFEEGQVLTL